MLLAHNAQKAVPHGWQTTVLGGR